MPEGKSVSPGMKINIVVGGRFHAPQLFHALTDLGHDVMIYASSPKRYFRTVPKDRVVFVPKPVQLLQKGLKRRMPRWLAESNSLMYDWIVSRIMRPADLVWGFNGDSLRCGEAVKRRGGVYIVDRACPHFAAQEELLVREARKTGYPYARFSERVRDRFTREYAIADAIVVPSDYSRGSFLERGFDDRRILVAPLDANAPRPGERDTGAREPRAPNGEFRIGLVGGSFLRKGIIYLLRAVKELDRPNVRLLIRANQANVTSHPEARMLCVELGVEFVPYLDDINSFYRGLDVFVLPSMDEGFGMVVYEALMNGTPVIASSNVGAIDGMEPGKDFLLVPAGDHHALAKALERLYSDPAFAVALGNAGSVFYRRRNAGGILYTKRIGAIVNMFSAQANGADID